MPEKLYPEICTTFLTVQHGVLTVTSYNHETGEGTFKRFDTVEQSDEFWHYQSKQQLPEWHKASCTVCQEAAGKNFVGPGGF